MDISGTRDDSTSREHSLLYERNHLKQKQRNILLVSEMQLPGKKVLINESEEIQGSFEQQLVANEPETNALIERLQQIKGLAPEQWKQKNVKARTVILQSIHDEIAKSYGFRVGFQRYFMQPVEIDARSFADLVHFQVYGGEA